MPPGMEVDMRRTKLKASEAALLAGELKKPSWQSKNEGIHERVSFEDSIWGFDLAGGSFYKTPLRVVGVKPDSRASKAGIRIGDKLTRINDIDTSTLTIQEAHEIIIESGIHLRLAVSAPEDEEDSYFCYEDPLESGYDSEEERRREEERVRKRQVHAKVSSYWSLQWPWVSKRRIIYRESNCFMVPSKYEDKHKDKFTPIPSQKYDDDIVHQNPTRAGGKKGATNNQDDPKTAEKNKAQEMAASNGAVSNGVADLSVNGKASDGWLRLMDDPEPPSDNNIINQQNGNIAPTNGHVVENVKENVSENGIENNPIESNGVNGLLDEEIEQTLNLVNENDKNNANGIQDSEEDMEVEEPENTAEKNMVNGIPEEEMDEDVAENGTDDDKPEVNDDEIINEILSAGDETGKGNEDGIIEGILNGDISRDSSSTSDER